MSVLRLFRYFISIKFILLIFSGVVAAELTVSPAEGLLGAPVSISLTGVEPGKRVFIDAEMTDDDGVVWSSRGIYRANDQGDVFVEKSASVSGTFGGTYDGVQPSALLWSMLPTPASKLSDWEVSKEFDLDTPKRPKLGQSNANVIRFKAYSAPHPVLEAKQYGEARYTRLLRGRDVVEKKIREGRVRGVVFEPQEANGAPAIVVISGSGGGILGNYGALLASHGFRVFALGWFGYEDRPQVAVRIPLEYFNEGIEWFRDYAGVEKVGLAGISYGGMGALWVAATYPEHIGAVFSGVPAHVHAEGVVPDGTVAPTFTLQGEDLAFVPAVSLVRSNPELLARAYSQVSAKYPMRSADIFLDAWNDADLPDEVITPVERIEAPIFITGGEDDGQWYSAIAGQRIVDRLKKNDFQYEVIFKTVPMGGHIIDYPRPVVNGMSVRHFNRFGQIWIDNGGVPSVNAMAQREIFSDAVSFFKVHLKND
ncbi:MAG: acyl-CoA thioesterase/bile acid-CoA:amino acid N-acyltransferase family protein [Pseudomonadota bacterium]